MNELRHDVKECRTPWGNAYALECRRCGAWIDILDLDRKEFEASGCPSKKDKFNRYVGKAKDE